MYDTDHFNYCVFVLKQRWGDAWLCPVSSQQQQRCGYYSSVLTATEWCADSQRGVKVQPASLPTPPSPMTTRSGMTLKRLQGPGPGPRSRRGTAVPGEKIFVTQIMCEAEQCYVWVTFLHWYKILPLNSWLLQSSRSFIWRRINTTPRTSMWRRKKKRRRRKTRTRRWRRGQRRRAEDEPAESRGWRWGGSSGSPTGGRDREVRARKHKCANEHESLKPTVQIFMYN